MFSGNPDATYQSTFDDYFVDASAFGSTVRRCKPENLGRDEVKEIARRVNADQGKAGDIQVNILDQDNFNVNKDFYVQFKICYKLC